MPMHVIVQPELAEMHALGYWAMEAPATQLVFGDIECGHRPNHYVVQRHRNSSGNLIAAENPGHRNRQQCLERIQRGEAKENSDGRPERDGVRRVDDRHQRHVMRNEPALHSREWFWQSRLVNWLGRVVRLLRVQF